MDDRRLQMEALFREGFTLREIGVQFGVSKQRIAQILSKLGISKTNGGMHVKALSKEMARDRGRDERCLIKYGCTYKQYKPLKGLIARRFFSQRTHASRRGIEWEFKLWDWWQVWQKSGKWKFRGRGQGYVMCRIGDVGPYSPDNVLIAPSRINLSETRRKKSGLPLGVRATKNSFFATRHIHGKRYYQGRFENPDEAHAEYLRWGGELRSEAL